MEFTLKEVGLILRLLEGKVVYKNPEEFNAYNELWYKFHREQIRLTEEYDEEIGHELTDEEKLYIRNDVTIVDEVLHEE